MTTTRPIPQPSARRRFAPDERAVSEVVGYLITFAISTIILVESLHAFTSIRDETQQIATERAIDEVAAQVAFAVEEALRAGALYPEAEFQMTVNIPKSVSGGTYKIELYDDHLWVIGSEADPKAINLATNEEIEVTGRTKEEFIRRAGTSVLCNGPGTAFGDNDQATCTVHSPEGELTVRYGYLEGPAGRGVYLSVR